MMFSKSFSYALRGILYVALRSEDQKRIQVDEIAKELSAPKHFLGKIMNRVVKEGVLNSTKGPYGGFSINTSTLNTLLIKIIGITDGIDQFSECVIHLGKCDPLKPCPLHSQLVNARESLLDTFSNTRIADLLNQDKINLVASIMKS
jgi:Rrf2 family iron-sulfur cluster assembly transcriptional regulator